MTLDRTDFSSAGITLVLHAAVILALSAAVIQAPPKKVALLTDVALIDSSEYRGQKGEEKKSAGVAPVQKKLGTTVKKVTPKPAEPKPADPVVKKEEPDVKALLKKIEEEKARLETAFSRDSLKDNRSEVTDDITREIEEDAHAADGETIAGGDPDITGALAARRYKKMDWIFPRKLPEETELMIEITVLSSGIIKDVRLVRTSGYPELDRMALSQARKMQFDPLPYKNEEQAGVLLFKFGARK